MNIVFSVRSKTDSSVQKFNQPLNGRMLIGRGPASPVPLDGPGISRDHVAIQFEDSVLFITDLSANGTWVNGTRLPLNRRFKIGEDDAIELPGYEIRVRLVGEDAPKPAITSGTGRKSAIAGPEDGASATWSPQSLMASFTLLERFLMVVSAASLVVWLLYLAS